MINLIGYTDVLMGILVLIVISRRTPPGQAVAAFAAGVLGVMLHELYLVAFLPVSLVGLVRWSEQEVGLQWRRLAYLLPTILVPVLLVIMLASHPTFSKAQVASFQQDLHARADFSVRDDFFRVYTSTSGDVVRQSLGFMRAGRWWVEESIQAMSFLPTSVFFVLVSFRFVPPHQKWTRRYIVLAVISPLALSFVGIDFNRWMEFSAFASIAAAIAMARLPLSAAGEQSKVTPIPFGIVWERAALLLIALNFGTNSAMFELNTKNFPFIQHWVQWKSNHDAHRPFLSPDTSDHFR
jgi:hypothetical protein